jgi:cytochrome bd-type quinol oxidase subunit 2
MIKRIKNFLTTVSLSALFLVPAMPLATVHAQTTDCLNSTGGTIAGCLEAGANKTDPNAQTVNASDRVDKTIRLVINVFSLIVGVVSVIMIIVGGLKYITSGGESGNITGAKNTILYAIIGLVVVALAQVVVKFVLQKTVQP